MIQRKHVNLKYILLWLFFTFFPIIPDYTRIGGRPVYVYISILVTLFTLVFALNSNGLRIKKDFTTIVMLSYSILIAIPVLMTVGIVAAIIIIFKYCTPLLITLYAVQNEENLEKIISLLIKAAVPIVLFSFLELIGFNIFSIIENTDLSTMGTNAQIRMGILRLEGPFGHAISYGIYLTFISALVQYKLIEETDKAYRRRLICILMLIFLAEVLTLSRAPIVVFVFTQVCVFLLYNTVKKVKIIARILVLLFVGAFALYAIGFDIVGLINSILAFFETLTSNSVSNSIDFGTNANPYEYRFALFDRVISMMHTSRIDFWVGDYLWENSFSVDNGYLSLLIFNGVIGLVARVGLYLYTAVIAVSNFFKNYRGNNSDKAFYYIAVVVMMGYLLNLASVAQMNETPTLLIIIGLILGKARLDKVNRRRGSQVI